MWDNHWAQVSLVFGIEKLPLNIDNDGWTKISLSRLIYIFGESIFVGSDESTLAVEPTFRITEN